MSKYIESAHYLKAKYPIAHTDKSLKVYLSKPQKLPAVTQGELEQSLKEWGQTVTDAELQQWVSELSKQSDMIVYWSIIAHDYEKRDRVIGVDDLQATLLALQTISDEIKIWEKETGCKLEYYFGVDTTIIYTPHHKKGV